jgi:murein DD-endopeptidase MepM/ murein hydrolase activator NlpD
MGARRTLTRTTFVTLVATLAAAITLTGPSAAAQQPDPVEDQIAAADAELKAAQVALADTYEAFTAAEQRHLTLSAAAKTAQDRVAQTRADADAAASRERDLRVEFDQFTSASYRHGSAIFSARAYVGSRSPSDLLDRASLLTALAGENGETMDATREAVAQKAEADREAQAALDQAVRDRDAANNAKVAAEQAYTTAVAVQGEAKAEAARLADRKASLVVRTGTGTATTAASGAVVRPAQGRLTSTYGARWGTIHYGVDIANSIGTPILSAMAGEVIDSGPASGFGLWVRVQHAGGVVTVYGHINESLVNVGQRVAAGEQIATMGNRGQSTGPHLHFEVHQDGSKIDPLPWLRSQGVTL